MKNRQTLWLILALAGTTFLNHFFQSAVLGSGTLALMVFFFSYAIGEHLFSHESMVWQWWLGWLFVSSWYIIAGFFTYFIAGFSNTALLALIWSPVIALFIFQKNLNFISLSELKRRCAIKASEIKPREVWFFSFHLGIAVLFTFSLWRSQTTEAIRDLWDVVPSYAWLMIFILLANTIFCGAKKKAALFGAFFTITLISFLMIPLIVFPLGFGFDPFIHQSTERYLLKHQEITPKTPYYIGYYALAVLSAKTTLLSVEWINRIMTIFFIATLLIPSWLYLKKNQTRLFGSFAPFVFFLGIPFGVFTTSTPQALGNIFLLVSSMFSTLFILTSEKKNLAAAIVAGTAATLIHPIAGVPAISLAILSCALLIKNKLKQKIYATLILLMSSFIFPALFFILNGLHFSRAPKNTIINLFSNLLSTPIIPNKFSALSDLVYLFHENIFWILAILAAAGFWRWRAKISSNLYFLPAVFLSMVLSTVIAARFTWPNLLVSYEQNAFLARMITTSAYLLLPLVFVGADVATEKITLAPKTVKLFFAGMLILGIGINLSTSYPHHDRYTVGRSYTVSGHDFNAVNLIEQSANGKKYVVLANQMTSVAALSQLGFERYEATEHGKLFIYPIPTSTPTYDLYLSMVYQNPSRETVEQAMKLFNADLGYFVISDYWTDAKKIIEKARRDADHVYEIDGGKITIFEYEKK